MTRPVKNLPGLVGTGDATHFGTNDLDQVNLLFTGQDQSATDPITTNTQWTATKVTMDSELNTLLNASQLATFTFYISGGLCKCRNWSTGITTSNSDAATNINNILTGAGANGGIFTFLANDFNISTPILIPIGTATGTKPFVFRGIPGVNRQTNNTTFTAGTGMSDQTYIIDASQGVTVGSNREPVIIVEGIFFWNPYALVQGGTVTSTSKSIGGILVACDNINGAGRNRVRLEQLRFQYMWRSIHFKGSIGWPYVDHIWFEDANATTVADCDLKIEKDIYSRSTNFGSFTNLRGSHSMILNNWIKTDSGYGFYFNLQQDGTMYTDCPILCTGATNLFHNVIVLDNNGVPSPDTRSAGALRFDGTGAYDNHVTWCHMGSAGGGNNPKQLAFTNGAYRNSVQMGYFGNPVSIDDSSAGIENVVYVFSGAQLSGTANTKIASTNGTVRIIDERKGTYGRGLSATQSGNGTTTVFNIAHGCFATPSYVNIQPATSAALGNYSLSATSTNIVVTYQTAPPTGTNNLQWYYNAEVYS